MSVVENIHKSTFPGTKWDILSQMTSGRRSNEPMGTALGCDVAIDTNDQSIRAKEICNIYHATKEAGLKVLLFYLSFFLYKKNLGS